MAKFNIGDKAYSKEGSTGKEIGTISEMDDGDVFVKLFPDFTEKRFNEKELLTEAEHLSLVEKEKEEWRKQNEENKNKWGLD